MDLEKKVGNKPGFFGKTKRNVLPYVFAAGLGLAGLGVVGCPSEVSPSPTPPDYTEEIVTITKAADRLVATQNNDGGWEWDNPDTDPTTNMPSPVNTIGVTAQGVLDAYKLTKKAAYLDTAVDAYGYISSLVGERIRGPDISFLVELSEETGNSTYANLAKDKYIDLFNSFGGGGATALAQYIRDIRKGQNLPSLISWDIDLYVQGVLALNRYFPGQGFNADAQDMAEVIYDSLYVNPVDFDLSNQTQAEYWLSHTGAIEAFTKTGLHTPERDSLLTELVSSQQSDGHFVGVNGGGDVQTTAYSVMSLLKAARRNPTVNAVDYMKNSQNPNGGWTETNGTEYSEVDSESAQAIFDYIQ